MATYLQSHDVPAPASASAMSRPSWRTAMLLLPYLWEFKGRVAVALVFLVAAKLANVSVPLILKQIVDSLDPTRAAIVLPFMLLLAYGLLRLSSARCGGLR
jgi:ATP-binding cassette subfamily B protein